MQEGMYDSIEMWPALQRVWLSRECGMCAGCTNIEKPFWGDACPVKSCCEQKSHFHCGQCADFPCDLLHAFAHDPEQGDDGKRIDQCREWALSAPVEP